MFLLASVSSLSIYDFLKKKSVLLAVSGMFLLIGSVGFVQITHASEIVAQKEMSYLPVKEAGKWLLLNSQPGDLIITQSQPQTVYYAHRPIKHISGFMNESEFEEYIRAHNAAYLMVSIFEYHPPWIFTWVTEHQNLLKAVYVSYADEAKTQPSLVLYQITYETN
jgi:hypothetical protein